MDSQIAWLAVDWGTSNLRVWGMTPDGSIGFARSSDQGMGKLVPAAFPGVLESLVGNDLPVDGGAIDALICGMAGARQGWMEAPYIDAPANLSSLAFGAVRPPMPGSRLLPRILPGVCQKRMGAEDVMRGEETQILGLGALLPDFAGVAILPGTHSKWVSVDGSTLSGSRQP